MTAYYNENDPFAAAWLRNLIAAGLIADGEVDERSIEDVFPIDLVGYTQCHFFAGIGGWSYAARLAGWPDSRPLWTGSCPCQPFSAAGKRGGMSDERHLWPAFFHLIQNGKPRDVPVFGEQVASPDGLAWLDLVQADLEGAGHSCWATDICAAGFGAPIIRQRLWWIAQETGGIEWNKRINKSAEAATCGLLGSTDAGERTSATVRTAGKWIDCSLRVASPQHPQRRTELKIDNDSHGWDGLRGSGDFSGMANNNNKGLERRGGMQERSSQLPAGESSLVDGMGDSQSGRCGIGRNAAQPRSSGHTDGSNRSTDRLACADGRKPGDRELQRSGEQRLKQEDSSPCERIERPGPTNGFWRDVDWLLCRDDKWRPVRPGTQPLAHGIPNRVGKLRGYGNAINAEAAAEVLRAYMDCCPGG